MLNNWFNNLNQQILFIIQTFPKFLMSHKKLLDVLKSYEVLNNGLNWIQIFICNKKQVFCFNNVLS